MFVPPLGTLSGCLFVCHLGSMCPISHRDSVGFSPADRTLQVNFPFILHIECHRRFPTAPVEHNVHVDHLLLVPPPPSCGRERGIKHHLMDDALSGIHRTSLEPRGGNEPPRIALLLKHSAYSGILSQAHEVPLRYAGAPRS